MSTEEIIRAWKSEDDENEQEAPANPAGEELSEEELETILGGGSCTAISCFTV